MQLGRLILRSNELPESHIKQTGNQLLLLTAFVETVEEKVKCIVQQQCEYSRLKEEDTNLLRLIYIMFPPCSVMGLQPAPTLSCCR